MLDKFRLKAALVEYKKCFVQTQWPDEKYKWEAVKCFQINWDVNSDNFAGMLTKALSQTGNLLASVNNFPAKMITKFAEIAREEVRAMFIELLMRAKMYMSVLIASSRNLTAFLKDTVMALVSIISTKTLYAHISGYAILTSITFTS